MIKLLIADDEPLVCVGLQSMLNWDSFGIDIVGTACNGAQAEEMIEGLKPDIVITDIKMPKKNGLDLARECREKYGRIPLFIILTSYEEFDLARQAIKAQAVDYLIKLELSPESLTSAVSKAVNLVNEHRSLQAPAGNHRGGMQVMREKFFIRLYNSLFESEEQYLAQKEDLKIDLSASAYIAVNCEIVVSESASLSAEKLLSLCASTVRMVRETLKKTHKCYITTMDIRHFSIAFCLESGDIDSQCDTLRNLLSRTVALVRNYYNVNLRAAAGTVVEDPLELRESYLAARRMLRCACSENPVVFSEGEPENEEAGFSFSGVKPDIRRAFEELDTESLHNALSEIADYYDARPGLRIQAMDAACNVLYIAISLLPGGDKTVAQIFADEAEGYRCIYRIHSTDAIVLWIRRLRDGCCEILCSQRQNYRRQVVASVQEYIRENLGKRLSLNDVAAVFNFSPSYLSRLFAKNADCGFVEFITAERVEAAKEMFARGEGRVNEVAERLGFESAFYFSKVFKKHVGVSPREYLQTHTDSAEVDDDA